MSIIIDRRLNAGKKSTVNRQRFLKRHGEMIRRSVQDAINKRSITDIGRGGDIHIPKKDLAEPKFHHAPGGRSEQVHPGNKEFSTGDRFSRPERSGGAGSGEGSASPSGEGVDDFIFQIDRDEFLHYIFDGLSLPNMVRKTLQDATEFSLRRAGFTSEGSPDKINVVRSLRAAHARRIALSGKERKEIRALKQQLRELEVQPEETDADEVETLKLRIEELNRQLKRRPFIDDFDLRYNNLIRVPQPSSKAVMFCIMDVSGSMTQLRKEIAKRFFLLLYLFLTCNYESVQVVFIRHHTEARECDENEFFYSRESGGTTVSTALNLVSKIIADRFPASQWNVYIAQASDGDNWPEDVPVCEEIIVHQLLPQSRYFAYIEIADSPQALWYAYQTIRKREPDYFAMERIASQKDIYPVFRQLFSTDAQDATQANTFHQESHHV
ncbi:hypothetical protein ACH42_03535 [Endozoicomonas sp. (ex Bugula neritina AB1)]|nr:hypothetical protein ACH42_03535 [Endozoicomonas sp. (ex Bugula neritina AB1)]